MARFTNQAQLRYGNAVANSNIAVGEILEVLSATKTAIQNTYGANDRITYILSVINAGSVPFNGLSVTDDLGAYLSDTEMHTPLTYREGTLKYYSNGILQSQPNIVTAEPLNITGLSIPAGGNITLIYETITNAYAPLEVNSTITNTAVINGGGITQIKATETIQADSAPQLTITKSVSPVPVTENGTLTYTFLIQNMGNTPADQDLNAVITDTFDPILSNLTVTYNAETWAEITNYTYDTATGLFSTVPGQITVPAASYVQDTQTGVWVVNPGVATLTISGTI